MNEPIKRHLVEKTLFNVLRWRAEGKNISMTLYEDIDGWDSNAFHIDKIKADDIFQILKKDITGIRFGIKYPNPKFGDPSSIGIQMHAREFGGVSLENDHLVIKEYNKRKKYALN